MSMFLVASLYGCADSENSEDVTTVSIDKSGKVTGTIVETLDKEYYDIEELKTIIDADIAQYNEQAGEDKIILESTDMNEQLAKAKITYADGESYAAFNDMIFFTGTVEEASAAGYEIDSADLKCVDETADAASYLADSSMRVIILEEPVRVRTFGNIRAMSSQMTLVNKKEATAVENEEQQLYLILFK